MTVYWLTNVMLESGYTYEELTDVSNKRCHSEDTQTILDNIDILVDGEFLLGKRDITLRFRGSSNQRVIDIKKTIESGTVTLSEYGEKK